MPKELLIIYEPALFLLAALGWAGWELWTVRTPKPKKGASAEAQDPPAPRDEPSAGG